jgi:hypothetical protein
VLIEKRKLSITQKVPNASAVTGYAQKATKKMLGQLLFHHGIEWQMLGDKWYANLNFWQCVIGILFNTYYKTAIFVGCLFRGK